MASRSAARRRRSACAPNAPAATETNPEIAPRTTKSWPMPRILLRCERPHDEPRSCKGVDSPVRRAYRRGMEHTIQRLIKVLGASAVENAGHDTRFVVAGADGTLQASVEAA